jgi:hypothetical protein
MLMAGCSKQPNNMRTPPCPVEKVHLIWKGTEWKVKLNDGSEQDPASARTELPKNSGPTMFVVDIQGNTPATFQDPGGLTVWEGSKSGPQGSAQILTPNVTRDGKRLFFIDLNEGNPVRLYYGFNFNNGLKPVDPIIDNGGSG